MNRTKDGRLQADPKRFPNGIKKLADYVRRSNSLFCVVYKYFLHLKYRRLRKIDRANQEDMHRFFYRFIPGDSNLGSTQVKATFCFFRQFCASGGWGGLFGHP